MKNQFKKSLSLVMAVLMILSCWVWIAPEKAEAAGGTTSYFIRMKYNVHDNWDNSEGKYKVYIDYKALNGTGSSGTHTVTPGEKWCAGEGEQWIVGTAEQSVKIDGFPYQVRVWGDPSGGRTYGWNNGVLEVSGDGTTWKTLISGMSYQVTNSLIDSDDKNVNATLTLGSVSSSNANYPKLTSVEGAASQELTLGVLGSAINVSVTPTLSAGKDQYGVSWEATFPTKDWKHKMALDGNGTTTGLSTSNISVSGTTNEPTITAKPDTQLLKENPLNGKVIYYLLSTYGSSTATTQVIVNYPTYQATFFANGGQIGIDKGNVSATGEVKVPESLDGAKTYYGAPIGKQPAYRYKEGYDFAGFYSQEYDVVNGLDASFDDNKKFVDNSTKITKDAPYNLKWYAAWKAKEITATFMTADNQLIGTVEGRYNNYLTNTNMYNGLNGLNAAVKAAYEGTAIQFDGNNAPIYKDGSTTYTFSHWKIIKGYDDAIVDKDHTATLKGDVTFQAVYTKSDAKKYTVSFEDGKGNILKDANGNAYTKNDYKFRDSVVMPSTEPTKAQDDKYEYTFIGWANNIGVPFYAVDENGKEESGATISYTSNDAAEFIVRGDASYVPVFRMSPREYSVKFNYTVDGGATESITVGGYHWDDVVKMPEGIKGNYTARGFRYPLTGWMVGTSLDIKQLDDITVNGPLVLTAAYGTGVGAEYTINFYDKEGNLINEGNNIYTHNMPVTVPEAGDGEGYDIPFTIDTEASLYTFSGWSPEVNATATADAEYYAKYTKKDYADVYFYNYDGTLLYSVNGKENGIFVGNAIPAYTGATPEKAEDEVGTYNFTGWKSGDDVVLPGTDTLSGDIHLYAQFETVYKEYTVKFLNDDGTVVSEKKYHYEEEIEVPADPAKASDDAYTYEFRGWSPEISKVCYGDATYTAIYRREYNYYKVTWLKDNKTIHSTSNYKFEAKIQPAVMNDPVAYPDATEGYTWAFKHWVQCDADGNDILVDGKKVIFTRGMKMPAEQIYFYPVFEEAANVLTVKFYQEDGTTYIGQTEVKYGEALADYVDAFEAEAYKNADETYHYLINDTWVNVDGGAAVITVTADVSVKPEFTAEEHTKDVKDIIIEPTCTETGLADVTCGLEECDKEWKNVVLDVIPDTAAPAGKLYVGSDIWNSGDAVDYSEIKYIGPNTKLVVNAQDKGSDASGLYRGVGKIEYYVSENVITDTSTIVNWNSQAIYDYEKKTNEVLQEVLNSKGLTMQDYIALSTPHNETKATIDAEVKAILATYFANTTGIASNLNLENGKTYIIYIRVSDREVNGQSNKTIFSSGKLYYGTTAPEITVTGDGFGTKFCADATITVKDDTDGVKAYIDGKEITLNADGTYKCEEKGVHTITVIDRNGNKASNTFEIKGGHSFRHYAIAADCESAGATYDICTVCGAKANEKTIPAIGHSFAKNYTYKAADCEADGYRTYVCDNNCGEKLILNPTDSAETLAQAKKWVDAAEGETEGQWVALTAEDLKDLKAAGHKYADEWVIDEESTCNTKGSKHKDCIVCGKKEARIIEEIDLDPAAHYFYRARVTKEATCTEKGVKTQTCRYCGHVEIIEYIDALGHEAGEYEITKAATCDEAGSKVRMCARCDIAIGEADEDGNYNTEDPVAVEIPKLGHAYKATGDIYEEDGKYYQNYVCSNDKNHTKREEVADYVPPVAATVTFDYNGGKVEAATSKSIEAKVGDTITVAQIGAEPKKAADKTYTYSFAYWATKNTDGTYTEVKFPIEVTAEEMTFYAVYAEKYINYTITYYKEVAKSDDALNIDGKYYDEYKKTGYIHNGETVTLAAAPSKAANWEFTYEFAAWAVYADTDSGKALQAVGGNEVTIDGANINLFATYNEVKKTYVVTYAITSSQILETFAVTAGSEARDCPIIPTKKADSKYHYEFSAWDKAADLTAVKNNIYATPVFTGAEHVYVETVKTPAACGVNAVHTFTCECGHSYDQEIAGSALEHRWGTPVYNEETGKNVVTCEREGCGVTEADTRTFTVKFFINKTDAKAIKTISYVPWGTTIDATRLPADPAKDSTTTTDYTFIGWADADGEVVEDLTKIEIKEDMTFYAVFETTTREYTVTFMYSATNVIKVYTNVPAGSTVVYEGETPVKAPDVNGHYTFNGWSGSTANIQGDVNVTAKFKKEDHTFKTTTLNEATCTNGTGTRYICDCGYFYDVTGKPLPHEYEEVNRVEASATANGYIDYKCKTCDATKREELIYDDNTITISVYVTLNGAAKSGIQVEIQPLGGGDPIFATTNANGVATFKVDEDGVYVCWVVIDGEKIEIALESAGSGNLEGYYSYSDVIECACACHRDNIWGAIFRFFHKIIKLFTGEFKCCVNPDPMYG